MEMEKFERAQILRKEQFNLSKMKDKIMKMEPRTNDEDYTWLRSTAYDAIDVISKKVDKEFKEL